MKAMFECLIIRKFWLDHVFMRQVACLDQHPSFTPRWAKWMPSLMAIVRRLKKERSYSRDSIPCMSWCLHGDWSIIESWSSTTAVNRKSWRFKALYLHPDFKVQYWSDYLFLKWPRVADCAVLWMYETVRANGIRGYSHRCIALCNLHTVCTTLPFCKKRYSIHVKITNDSCRGAPRQGPITRLYWGWYNAFGVL